MLKIYEVPEFLEKMQKLICRLPKTLHNLRIAKAKANSNPVYDAYVTLFHCIFCI